MNRRLVSLARRFYGSSYFTGPPTAGECSTALRATFIAQFYAATDAERSAVWLAFGLLQRDAPRARWSRWLESVARFRRRALQYPPGWSREHNKRLARKFWAERDVRNLDAASFRLP